MGSDYKLSELLYSTYSLSKYCNIDAKIQKLEYRTHKLICKPAALLLLLLKYAAVSRRNDKFCTCAIRQQVRYCITEIEGKILKQVSTQLHSRNDNILVGQMAHNIISVKLKYKWMKQLQEQLRMTVRARFDETHELEAVLERFQKKKTVFPPLCSTPTQTKNC